MENFLCLGQNQDIIPVLHELKIQPDIWGASNVRRWHAKSVHHAANDVILRYNAWTEKDAEGGEDAYLDKVCSSIMVVNYPVLALCPITRGIVMALMSRVTGEHLGRVIVAKLPPGESIPPHSDIIEPASHKFPDRIPPAIYYERYHLVLKSQPGVVFTCGDEKVQMNTGELWWFDNTKVHEVVNNSAEERIHLIVDVHTAWSPSP